MKKCGDVTTFFFHLNEGAKMNEEIKPIETEVVNFIEEKSIEKITFSDKKIEQDNKETLELADKIETFLKFWGEFSIIPIVNANSINLKLSETYEQLNNTLIIAPKGGGKSTLLKQILIKSNPKFIVGLPKKMFESELVKKGNDFFNDKILVHDDLITAFNGVSSKQREQLTNFWTQLLSHYSYSRENYRIDAKCACLFGIASESFGKYKNQLFESTFLDRFIMSQKMSVEGEEEVVLEHRDYLKQNKINFPTIKLPFTKSKKSVEMEYDKTFLKERNKYALELNTYNIMTAQRAQNYIDIFMMSNALLNGRKKVSQSDLEIYKLVHPFHIGVNFYDVDKERIVLQSIKTDPMLKDKARAETLSISRSYLYQLKANLRKKGAI